VTDNLPLAYDIAAVALVLLWALVRHIIRSNRARRPAATDTARWTPRDWPVCNGAHCSFPGTNRIVWTRSGVEGDLCPGCRDTNISKGLARDAWDEAS